MISNFVYMIYGLILVLFVWIMEVELLVWCYRFVCNRKLRFWLFEGEDEFLNYCIKCFCIDVYLVNMFVLYF